MIIKSIDLTFDIYSSHLLSFWYAIANYSNRYQWSLINNCDLSWNIYRRVFKKSFFFWNYFCILLNIFEKKLIAEKSETFESSELTEIRIKELKDRHKLDVEKLENERASTWNFNLIFKWGFFLGKWNRMRKKSTFGKHLQLDSDII